MKGLLVLVMATPPFVAAAEAQQPAQGPTAPEAHQAAGGASLYRRYTELRAQPAETAEQAERLISEAQIMLAEDPEFAPAYMLLGKGLYYRARRRDNDAGSFQAAREAFQKALKLDRQLLSASAELAILLHRQGKPGEARRAYYDSFGEFLTPLAYLSWREGRLAEAHRWSTLASNFSKDESWLDYRARIASWLGNYSEAASLYRELILKGYRGTLIRAALAEVHWAAGEEEAARRVAAETFAHVERTDPERVGTAYGETARLALRLGEEKRALSYARRGLEHRPDDELLSLIVAHLTSRAEPAAAETLLEAVRRRSMAGIGAGATDWSPRLHMAIAHAIRGETAAALAMLQEAVGVGYRGAAALEGDPLLQSLRSRPEFRAILADIRAKVAAERAALSFPPAAL